MSPRGNIYGKIKVNVGLVHVWYIIYACLSQAKNLYMNLVTLFTASSGTLSTSAPATACKYIYMYVHDKQTSRYLPNIHKETQHNSTTPEEDFFSEKNQLPQVGLEPTTLCSLDECSTN